jgi:hypothetical protein
MTMGYKREAIQVIEGLSVKIRPMKPEICHGISRESEAPTRLVGCRLQVRKTH